MLKKFIILFVFFCLVQKREKLENLKENYEHLSDENLNLKQKLEMMSKYKKLQNSINEEHTERVKLKAKYEHEQQEHQGRERRF